MTVIIIVIVIEILFIKELRSTTALFFITHFCNKFETEKFKYMHS